MHSPPPTPHTRSNGHAPRISSRLTDILENPDLSQQPSKKRTFAQAGLITPRETPQKKTTQKSGQLATIETAKILFPSTKRRKFRVFQDPQSPDPFCDDIKNPFAIPAPTITNNPPCDTTNTAKVCDPATPDQPTCSEPEVDAQPSVRQTRSMARSTSPRRTDGMTYVFRGRKVFRKYNSAEDAELAEEVKPKRLFVKEMSAPKLSNPFDEDSEDEDDALELDSSYLSFAKH